MRLRTAVQNRPEYSTFIAVDALNQHNTDLFACLWNDLYTVINLQKEKRKQSTIRHPHHIIIRHCWLIMLLNGGPSQLSYIYRFIKKCLNFCLDNWTTILACGTVDLRKGINGLATIISDKYGQNLFEKRTLFLFCRKRSDRCKGLLWMGTGFLLLYKRFEAGRLSWPRNTQEAADLTEEQYKYDGFKSLGSQNQRCQSEKYLLNRLYKTEKIYFLFCCWKELLSFTMDDRFRTIR